MKQVGRCVEQPRGERKKAPVPICFTTKHLCFALISKVCFAAVPLSSQPWRKARGKDIFHLLYSHEKMGRDVSALRSSLPAPNVFGLNVSVYRDTCALMERPLWGLSPET